MNWEIEKGNSEVNGSKKYPNWIWL